MTKWLFAPCLALLGCQDDGTSAPPVPADAGSDPICTQCGACEERFTTGEAKHVSGDLSYPDPPPVAGDHNPTWSRWGVHDEAVPDQCFVHNLEHGGIVFLYQCPTGCADDVAKLAALVMKHPRSLLTSYGDMPAGFAVLAWGRRIVSPCLDVDAFDAFASGYTDQGPESVAANPSKECQ